MCDCGTEGVVVATESEPYENAADGPFVELAFFGQGHQKDGRLGWVARLLIIWRIIRKGNVFNDMVIMQRSTARNLAHHLLYITSRDKKPVQEEPQQEPLVKE
jgi:hypothetical protein